MKQELLIEHDREIEIEFKGDRYLVHDNGAVYRMHRPGLRRSSIDEVWTFGTRDEGSGYMRLGRDLIHRIAAVAFLGPPPSNGHVVDHVDMDRGNNRPGNLRWVTRLTNVIRHADTRRRITRAYGSLDNFFENPSAMVDDSDQSIDWLKAVSREDAERSREQLLLWGESDGRPKDRILGTEFMIHRARHRPLQQRFREQTVADPHGDSAQVEDTDRVPELSERAWTGSARRVCR